jgi:demethylmenaquinone methyltransferase/2-methoxy-6-polyprenyl-1,4-benzoquinol methylase
VVRDAWPVDDLDLLAEQRAFYRARAPEYDEWWECTGRYDRGPDKRAEWQRQVSVVEQALDSFGAVGNVLELAGGTGWWTQRLARTAQQLTVVDASAETLALNRQRVGRSDVTLIEADLFHWQPSTTYDVVFFSFWLSHVPRPRFASFWRLVRSCLSPGGRAFLIDSRNDPFSAPGGDPYVSSYEPDLHIRRLSNGSQWRVVKVMYEPDELASLIEAEGWTASMDATRWFLYGSAEPH